MKILVDQLKKHGQPSKVAWILPCIPPDSSTFWNLKQQPSPEITQTFEIDHNWLSMTQNEVKQDQGADSPCYGNSDALNAAQMLFGMPFGRAVWEGEIRPGPIQRIKNRFKIPIFWWNVNPESTIRQNEWILLLKESIHESGIYSNPSCRSASASTISPLSAIGRLYCRNLK